MMKKILRKGDRIIVEKGVLGSTSGTFIKAAGISCFGLWGLYKDIYGEERLFDETVHRIIKLD